MAQRFVRFFESGVNESLDHLVQRVQHWLQATNPLVIISARFEQLLVRKNAHKYRLLLVYFKGMHSVFGGRPTQVQLFRTTLHAPASQVAAAFLALGNAAAAAPRLQAVLDVSSVERSEPDKVALLVFYDDFSVRRNVGNPKQAFIAYTQHQAIPPHSWGIVDLYDSFGAPAALQVPLYNVGEYTWDQYRTNYAVLCQQTGAWVGTAPCIAGAPQDNPDLARTYRAFRYPLAPDYTGDLRQLEVPYLGLPLSTEP